MTWSLVARDTHGAFGVAVARLPRRADPAGVTDRAVIEAANERFQATRTDRPGSS